MNSPHSQLTRTSLVAWAVALVACVVAAPVVAQPAVPPYSMIFSDEGGGLPCLPQFGSTTDKVATVSECMDWIESGAGKEAFEMAISEACQPQGVNVDVCETYFEMQLSEAIAYIEQFTPQQIVSTGGPLAGATLAFLASSASTTLTGAAYRGGTYANGEGTATLHIDVQLGPGKPAVPGYNIVYSTTTSPLTTFQGSDGNTYPVYAILYGGPAPAIPVASAWGLAVLSLAVLLAGVLVVARRR